MHAFKTSQHNRRLAHWLSQSQAMGNERMQKGGRVQACLLLACWTAAHCCCAKKTGKASMKEQQPTLTPW